MISKAQNDIESLPEPDVNTENSTVSAANDEMNVDSTASDNIVGVEKKEAKHEPAADEMKDQGESAYAPDQTDELAEIVATFEINVSADAGASEDHDGNGDEPACVEEQGERSACSESTVEKITPNEDGEATESEDPNMEEIVTAPKLNDKEPNNENVENEIIEKTQSGDRKMNELDDVTSSKAESSPSKHDQNLDAETEIKLNNIKPETNEEVPANLEEDSEVASIDTILQTDSGKANLLNAWSLSKDEDDADSKSPPEEIAQNTSVDSENSQLLRGWSHDKEEQGIAKIIRKASVAVTGSALVVAGIPMIPMPTPGGVVVVGSGMALLATEFPAAQKALDRSRQGLANMVGDESDDDEEKKEKKKKMAKIAELVFEDEEQAKKKKEKKIISQHLQVSNIKRGKPKIFDNEDLNEFKEKTANAAKGAKRNVKRFIRGTILPIMEKMTGTPPKKSPEKKSAEKNKNAKDRSFKLRGFVRSPKASNVTKPSDNPEKNPTQEKLPADSSDLQECSKQS